MIRYHFDLYDDPEGTLLVRFTQLQSAEYRGEANGTGAGRVTIRATDAEAQFINPAGLQYIRVVRDDGSTELVIGGFFTERGSFSILSGTSNKLLSIGGAGPVSYLQRAVMDADSWLTDPFNGTDPQPDGTWPLHKAGTGNSLGAIAWRILRELQEAGRWQNPLPAMSLGFTYLLDSNGNPWVRTSGDFVAQVSEGVYPNLQELMQLGLYLEVDPDTFEVRAFEPETHRRDRTGGAFAADVVRFQAGVNIESDATREIEARIKRNGLLVGSNDTWEWVTDPGVTPPWEGGYVLDDESGTSLGDAGAAQIAARSDAGDVFHFRMKVGDDEGNGVYLPFEHVKLDDLVTVHTGTGALDYDEQTFPVAALTLTLRQGGDWDCWVDLGSTYTSMAERAFQAQPVKAHNHPPNPKLCPPMTEGSGASCSMDPSLMEQIPTPNGDWELGNGTHWTTGSPTAGDPEGVGGSWYFANTGVGPGGLTYDALAGLTFEAGQTYVAYVFVDASSLQLTFDFGQGAAGGPMSGDFATMQTVPGLNCLPWTPSADRTGVRIALSRAGSGTIAFDNVRVYTGGLGANPLNGLFTCAARGDHRHIQRLPRDPSATDDADHGYLFLTIWVNSITGDTFLSTDDSAGAAVWLPDPFGAAGVTDHGALTGLADDDHPQYLTTSDHTAIAHPELTEAEHDALDHMDLGHWEPVTNGDVGSPEIVFDDGDVVMQWVP